MHGTYKIIFSLNVYKIQMTLTYDIEVASNFKRK